MRARVVLLLCLVCTGIDGIYDFSTIDVSGFYRLAANVSDQITISVSDVTLDLNGHTVSGGTNGIVINSNLNNISIKNGTVASVTLDGIQINSGCSDISIENVVLKQALVGIAIDTAANCMVRSCDMNLNTTGLQCDSCANILVENCFASANSQAGYDLLSTTTCSFINCKAVSSGDGNTNASGNNASVFGFSTRAGYGNVFEKCIANSTQNLNATDDRVIIAGFGMRNGESCSKIIECQASNSMSNENGATVPYGIWLEATFEQLTTLTIVDTVGPQHRVDGFSWAPDGSYYAEMGEFSNDVLNIFSYDYAVNRAQFLVDFDVTSFTNVYAIEWHPDGRFLAFGGNKASGQLVLLEYDPINNSLVERDAQDYSGTSGDSIYTINWSYDGRFLAVGGIINTASQIVRIYEFDRVARMLTLVDGITDTDRNFSVRWSPDGNYIAMGNNTSAAQEIQIYSFDRTTKTVVLPAVATVALTAGAGAVEWSQDGKFLAVFTASTTTGLQLYEFDGTTITLRDSVTGISTLTGNSAFFSSLHFTKDGRFLVVGGNNTITGISVYFFDRDSKTLTFVDSYSDSSTPCCAQWSPDGSLLAMGRGNSGQDQNVFIFSGLQFPEKNIIMGNTVYCNSNGTIGAGISGSSIKNIIIQNSAYDNINNYFFATNVFNQLFGQGPTLLQNIELAAYQVVLTPMDVPAKLGHVESLLELLADSLV